MDYPILYLGFNPTFPFLCPLCNHIATNIRSYLASLDCLQEEKWGRPSYLICVLCTVLQFVVSPLWRILNVFVLCFRRVFGILSLKIVIFLHQRSLLPKVCVSLIKLGPSVLLSTMCSLRLNDCYALCSAGSKMGIVIQIQSSFSGERQMFWETS